MHAAAECQVHECMLGAWPAWHSAPAKFVCQADSLAGCLSPGAFPPADQLLWALCQYEARAQVCQTILVNQTTMEVLKCPNLVPAVLGTQAEASSTDSCVQAVLLNRWWGLPFRPTMTMIMP
mmetsp:Transcript_1087/g.2982  ORF Transcript_1087/g.2982 Transcript_1087/m.2982 type:complete len:122 (-) Transcript_1087:1689-2054(-)